MAASRTGPRVRIGATLAQVLTLLTTVGWPCTPAVTGYGGADKHQVQVMVQAILELDVLPKPDDAADALAVAICHLHSYRWNMNQA